MRSPEVIKQVILEIATIDDRIRAVLLIGSRANRNISPDRYQDFDVVFVVNNFEQLTSDHKWIDAFGERLLWQLPDNMDIDIARDKSSRVFHYLMLLADGNRIDVTIVAADQVTDRLPIEGAFLVWLDKDDLYHGKEMSNDNDHLIRPPGEKEFLDTCNEFWWISTNVAKGLLRNEITYAKEMLERCVRPMFMKILEWHIGITSDFSVSFGKAGRFMKQHLSREMYDKVLATYADSDVERNWQALFSMMNLFGKIASFVGEDLGFAYNIEEERNVRKYVQQLHHGDR